MDNGQMTPRGHPDFNSYIKNLRVLVFRTDGRTDRDINPVWASLTMVLQVKLTLKGSKLLTLCEENLSTSVHFHHFIGISINYRRGEN